MEQGIKYRHNIMNINSIETFSKVRGGFHQNCRDVYFVRALGVGDDFSNQILQIDKSMEKDRKTKRLLLYKRFAKLPALVSLEDSRAYLQCCENWVQNKELNIATKKSMINPKLSPILKNACQTILEKYHQIKPNATESIQKNFMVKLLYWFDFVLEEAIEEWNEKSCIKIFAENISKEQEYLFFYFLTLVGCDVLLLQSKKDVELPKELKELSVEIVLGDYSSIDLPEYKPETEQNLKQNTVVNQEKCKLDKTKAAPSSLQGTAAGKEQNKLSEVNTQNSEQQNAIVNQREYTSNRNIKVQIPERSQKKTKTQNSSPSIISQQADENKNVNKTFRSQETKIQTEKSFEELARLASSIVMIAVHNNKGDIVSTGSGIMIGRNGFILTNYHVVGRGSFFSVRIEDDEKIYQTNEIIKYHSVLDLAIIRIDHKVKPLPIYKGKKELTRGQKVVAIGSPLGLFNSVSDGIISGFRTIQSVDMIQFTAPISPGSSGGAVLNMFGEVIGISTAGIDEGQNINLAVEYKCINMFVEGFI